ncbi:MAG: outer membrane beta-barrel protein, partial [Pseudobdellovibrionaceae bacterium]|nr:outer membrane beta-barrel protein [Pseudobdellovibrionaceae bacterium]
MVRSMIALAFVLAASTAFAEVTIKPKLIHSQLTLDAKSTVDDEGIEEDVDGGKRWVPGKGAGVDFEFSLNERARVGAGLSYTEFERYDTRHFDTALGGYAALDLLKTDAFSLYGKAGLSAHQFGTETFKPATLLNVDLGAGAAVAVAQNVDVGAEYQYSTSLVK